EAATTGTARASVCRGAGGDRHWRRSSSSGGNLARELTVGSLARRRQRIFGFGEWRGSHAQISVSAENAVVSNTVRRAVAQLGSALHWGLSALATATQQKIQQRVVAQLGSAPHWG